ncbi:hypothetical protein DFJ74DRAFT_753607 [Hyaloraphidium curvatum]|nr:hypothetical protein DFJ74DRAFT_753607 [Hyaloraphidium curvatum]
MIRILFAGKEFSAGVPLARQAARDLVAAANASGANPGKLDIEVATCSREELVSRVDGYDVLVPLMSRIDAAILEAGKNSLKLVMQFGVGLEGVDVAAATRLGIPVTNIPSAPSGNALSVAEHAIYLTLAALRKQHEMAAAFGSQTLGAPIGTTLFGRTVLIIGFGNIARELVPRLKGFGVRMLAARRSPWGPTANGTSSAPETSEGDVTPVTTMPRPKLPVPAGFLPIPSLDAVAAAMVATTESHNNVPPPPDPQHLLDERHPWSAIPDIVGLADIVVLTCNLTPETRGMINRDLLSRCKDGVIVVNVARGGLLDREATLEALESGKLGGLAADVQWEEPFDPQDPVARHPRVVMTPHIGGVTDVSYANMARKLVEESWRVVGLKEKPKIRINDV